MKFCALLHFQGEKFSLVLVIGLSNEEWRCSEAMSSAGTIVDLMVEELLDMVNGEEMFMVH
jgi:hypothetical protein